jgi:hypothetical protein
MKVALNILVAFLALIGVVWTSQGVNILPGSFVTGHLQWAVYGAIAPALGCAALYFRRRCARP